MRLFTEVMSWHSYERAQGRPYASSFHASNYVWKKFVSLDGENSTYTTVLLICMNLGVPASRQLLTIFGFSLVARVGL